MKSPYPHLLQPVQIGRFVLKNRLMSSNSMPHFSQGPESFPAQPTMAHFLGRARSGAAFVTINGIDDNYGMPDVSDKMDFSHFADFDMHDARCQNYMVELVEAMHAEGTLVSGALFSASRIYRCENERGEVEAVDTNNRALSDYEGMFGIVNDGTPAEYFPKVAESYGQRTRLFKRLGFDAVTLHMSYRSQLPSQMFSPLTNKRTDEFGGSFENRIRFPLMVLKKIREAAGNDMLIELQFTPEERTGGYSFEEGMRFLKLAEPYLDIVQIRPDDVDSSHPIPFELRHMPFLELTGKVKQQKFDFLIGGIGGYFYPEDAEAALAEGSLDLVSMARAWISNPEYGDMLYYDRAEDLVPCLRCNKCHGRSPSDIFATTCSVNPKLGFEVVDPYFETPIGQKQEIAIIGGGPGGMRAAIYLSDRGHHVTVYEKEAELGGIIRHADMVDFKWTLKDYKDYLIRQVGKRNIKVYLNTEAVPEMIEGKYDTVIAAVGAKPYLPPIPGIDSERVMLAIECYYHPEKVGKNVVVIGGGEVGTEVGIFLARTGRYVNVIARRDMLAHDAAEKHYRSMMEKEWKALNTFGYVLNGNAIAIDDNYVIYEVKGTGLTLKLKADTVVIAAGMRARTEEAMSYYGTAPRFYMLGDCTKPGSVQTVNRMAYVISRNI